MTTTPRLATLIRSGRAQVGLTQAELGAQLGKSRQWVAQLEGASLRGRPFRISPDEIVKAAAILKLPPSGLLEAAEVPRPEWPNLSYMRSTDAKITTVDLTPLTARQQDVILELVRILRAGNHNETGKTDRHL